MSSYREKVLIDIKERIKTSSRISKSINISISPVNTVFKELMDNGFVISLNPEKNKVESIELLN